MENTECLWKTVRYSWFFSPPGLSRFTYDETMPATPDKRAEGLQSLRRIRLCSRLFPLIRRLTMDVFVKYEVGMSGENGLQQRSY